MIPTAKNESWANQEPVNAKEIKREVWWAFPPEPGDRDEDIRWGYLVWYDNDDVRFLDEPPTDEEIANRDGCLLADQSERGAL